MAKKKTTPQRRNTDSDRVKAAIMAIESCHRDFRESFREAIEEAVSGYFNNLEQLTKVEARYLEIFCREDDKMPDDPHIQGLLEKTAEYKATRRYADSFLTRIQSIVFAERFGTTPSLMDLIKEAEKMRVRTNTMLQAEVTFRHEKTNLAPVVNNTTTKRKKKSKK